MKLLFTFILLSSLCFGQSKKDLTQTILKLKTDSTALELKVMEQNITISSLNENNRKLTETTEKLYANKSILEQKVQKHQSTNIALLDSISNLNSLLNDARNVKALSLFDLKQIRKGFGYEFICKGENCSYRYLHQNGRCFYA